MQTKFPRRVHPENSHYLLHKVRRAYIGEDGILKFEYEDEVGNIKATGPAYLSLINGKKPLAIKEMKKDGISIPEQVKYLIAYHSGAYPNGFPAILLSSLDDIPKSLTDRLESEALANEKIDAIKSMLYARIDEWLGNDIPEEEDEDYEQWQSRLAEVDAIESLDDVIEYLGGEEEAREILDGYDISI